MENQANVLFVAPGNLWLRLTTQQQTSSDAATAGTAAAVAVERVDTWVTYTPVLATGSGIDTNQRILNMELYI
jgi:formylmethanofuran:tetrahydromethanopterin formyltransferase